ncbi:hypothetical protein VTJ49DRAFT_3613 [Mycothermus thermophilus]|uniref:Uncharacterized protein n=1 Tax=Humicola insolens TaxID=85995 RepID=A0ABR3V7H8_HUMIN
MMDGPSSRLPAAPPKAKAVDDLQISLRLRYGVHVIFIIAMLDWTFEQLTTELLSILRDRYPEGLRREPPLPSLPGLPTAPSSEETTPIPAEGADVRVAYALPQNPNDFSAGWKNLKAQPGDTLKKKGIKDWSSLAFVFVDADESDADTEFHVVVPSVPEESAV